MATGFILGGGPGGDYTIRLDYGSAVIEARIAAIVERLGPIVDKIVEVEGLIGDMEAEGEGALAEAAAEANEAYVAAVTERCTDEGWVVDELDTYYAELRATLQYLARLRDDIYNAQVAKADAVKVVEELEPLLDAAKSAYEDAVKNEESTRHAYADAFHRLDDKKIQCWDEGNLSPECWEEEFSALVFAYVNWQLAFLFELPDAQAEYDALTQEMIDAEQDLAEKTAELEELEQDLEGVEEDYAQAAKEYKDALLKFKDVLVRCEPKMFIKEIKAVDDAIKALQTWRNELEILKTRLRDLLALRTTLEVEKEYFETFDLPAMTEDLHAWCADLSEDLEDEVTIMAVPGEPQNILIAPGSGGLTPTDSESLLLARAAMTPEQAYANAAILPGWQKWRPTYRAGTITDIDYEADTASVALDIAFSSAADLEINQPEPLTNIPVSYMNCDADAFLVGDRVIVQFPFAWSGATVIGFESHPVGCPEQALSVGIRWEDAGTSDADGSTAVSCETGAGCMYQDYTLYVVFPDGTRLNLFTPTGSACFFDCYPMTVNGVTWGVGIDAFRKDINENLIIYSCDDYTGSYSFESHPFSAGLPSDFATPPAAIDIDGWHYTYSGVVSGALVYDLAGHSP